jgi:hypothetical protein
VRRFDVGAPFRSSKPLRLESERLVVEPERLFWREPFEVERRDLYLVNREGRDFL